MIVKYYKSGLVLIKKRTDNKKLRYYHYSARRKNNTGYAGKKFIRKETYNRLVDRNKSSLLRTLYFNDKNKNNLSKK